MPVVGPFAPIPAPPLAGVAPPPLGPRSVSPAVIGAVKEAITKLLSIVDLERDEGLKHHVDQVVAPLIKHAIQIRHQLSEPITADSEEAEDADTRPLDRTPPGEPMRSGTPMAAALPRLMGLGGG